MAKYIKAGDTIEGDSVGIRVRKWTPASIVDVPTVKKKMYRYSSSRNSYAVVKNAHEVSRDPEIVLATQSFHREVGDEVECSGMKVYVDSKRRIKVVSREGATHTHGAIYATTDKHTIATVSTPLANLLKAIAKQESLEMALKKG
ncbi:MAG: hypothetical protein IJU08_09840 [Bacteroidales bacterium]|nr:hypothetical protein [Bacteroidales bacterium]